MENSTEQEIQKIITIKLKPLGGKKKTTLITGFPEEEGMALSKELKSKLSVGGTYKKKTNEIVLQGDFVGKAKVLIENMAAYKEFKVVL